ncbi:hypothetical protein GCM10020000_15560 [Streptomyces olivoverticillatus]
MSTERPESAERRPAYAPDEPPDLPLVVIGCAAVLAVVAWAALGKHSFDQVSTAALSWVLSNFAWLFVIAADVFLVLCVVIAVSRFGRIRLGADDDQPEFGNLAWIAMMFSAGMGIGLMFYGVGEPLQHFVDPPPGSGVTAGSPAAARTALEYSFFHWTPAPLGDLRHGGAGARLRRFPQGPRQPAQLGVRPPCSARSGRLGWPGRCIDLLAVFATVFGTATSLGLGALQVSKGLNITTGVRDTTTLELTVICSLSAAFVLSAFSGLHKGVKWLSTLNIVLAACLMLFVFLLGPTVFVLNTIPAAAGGYLHDLLTLATRTGAFTDSTWLGAWTIFYWAWWLSWAPFVGTFIARISHGRTIREFLIGVLLVPSGATVVWFCVMGGSALRLDMTGAADMAGTVKEGAEASLFALLDTLPLATLSSWIAMALVMTYFITSADSASLVMGSLSSRGALHPRTWLVVLWGVLMAAVAAVLLVAGGAEVAAVGDDPGGAAVRAGDARAVLVAAHRAAHGPRCGPGAPPRDARAGGRAAHDGRRGGHRAGPGPASAAAPGGRERARPRQGRRQG